MRLFLTIEAQNCTENGLAQLLTETINKLNFLIDNSLNLEDQDNYGTEFRHIAIIPSCMDDNFWQALGWKERKQFCRKKGEADIRLRMNYERFINETPKNQRLLFYEIIVRSIRLVQENSKGDFRGIELINDILTALDVSQEELKQLNDVL